MKSSPNHPQQELQELSHEEQPGYRVVFIITLIVTVSTLVLSFLLAGDVTTHP